MAKKRKNKRDCKENLRSLFQEPPDKERNGKERIAEWVLGNFLPPDESAGTPPLGETPTEAASQTPTEEQLKKAAEQTQAEVPPTVTPPGAEGGPATTNEEHQAAIGDGRSMLAETDARLKEVFDHVRRVAEFWSKKDIPKKIGAGGNTALSRAVSDLSGWFSKVEDLDPASLSMTDLQIDGEKTLQENLSQSTKARELSTGERVESLASYADEQIDELQISLEEEGSTKQIVNKLSDLIRRADKEFIEGLDAVEGRIEEYRLIDDSASELSVSEQQEAVFADIVSSTKALRVKSTTELSAYAKRGMEGRKEARAAASKDTISSVIAKVLKESDERKVSFDSAEQLVRTISLVQELIASRDRLSDKAKRLEDLKLPLDKNRQERLEILNIYVNEIREEYFFYTIKSALKDPNYPIKTTGGSEKTIFDYVKGGQIFKSGARKSVYQYLLSQFSGHGKSSPEVEKSADRVILSTMLARAPEVAKEVMGFGTMVEEILTSSADGIITDSIVVSFANSLSEKLGSNKTFNELRMDEAKLFLAESSGDFIKNPTLRGLFARKLSRIVTKDLEDTYYLGNKESFHLQQEMDHISRDGRVWIINNLDRLIGGRPGDEGAPSIWEKRKDRRGIPALMINSFSTLVTTRIAEQDIRRVDERLPELTVAEREKFARGLENRIRGKITKRRKELEKSANLESVLDEDDKGLRRKELEVEAELDVGVDLLEQVLETNRTSNAEINAEREKKNIDKSQDSPGVKEEKKKAVESRLEAAIARAKKSKFSKKEKARYKEDLRHRYVGLGEEWVQTGYQTPLSMAVNPSEESRRAEQNRRKKTSGEVAWLKAMRVLGGRDGAIETIKEILNDHIQATDSLKESTRIVFFRERFPAHFPANSEKVPKKVQQRDGTGHKSIDSLIRAAILNDIALPVEEHDRSEGAIFSEENRKFIRDKLLNWTKGIEKEWRERGNTDYPPSKFYDEKKRDFEKSLKADGKDSNERRLELLLFSQKALTVKNKANNESINTVLRNVLLSARKERNTFAPGNLEGVAPFMDNSTRKNFFIDPSLTDPTSDPVGVFEREGTPEWGSDRKAKFIDDWVDSRIEYDDRVRLLHIRDRERSDLRKRISKRDRDRARFPINEGTTTEDGRRDAYASLWRIIREEYESHEEGNFYLLSQERKLESHHAERRIKHFHEKIRKFALAANEAAKKEDKKPKGDVVFPTEADVEQALLIFERIVLAERTILSVKGVRQKFAFPVLEAKRKEDRLREQAERELEKAQSADAIVPHADRRQQPDRGEVVTISRRSAESDLLTEQELEANRRLKEEAAEERKASEAEVAELRSRRSLVHEVMGQIWAFAPESMREHFKTFPFRGEGFRTYHIKGGMGFAVRDPREQSGGWSEYGGLSKQEAKELRAGEERVVTEKTHSQLVGLIQSLHLFSERLIVDLGNEMHMKHSSRLGNAKAAKSQVQNLSNMMNPDGVHADKDPLSSIRVRLRDIKRSLNLRVAELSEGKGLDADADRELDLIKGLLDLNPNHLIIATNPDEAKAAGVREGEFRNLVDKDGNKLTRSRDESSEEFQERYNEAYDLLEVKVMDFLLGVQDLQLVDGNDNRVDVQRDLGQLKTYFSGEMTSAKSSVGQLRDALEQAQRLSLSGKQEDQENFLTLLRLDAVKMMNDDPTHVYLSEDQVPPNAPKNKEAEYAAVAKKKWEEDKKKADGLEWDEVREKAITNWAKDKTTGGGAMFNQLRDTYPDSPIVDKSLIVGVIKASFPDLDVFPNDDGTIRIVATLEDGGTREVKVEYNQDLGTRTTTDGEKIVGGGFWSAGQQVVDEDGNVVFTEEDVIKLSGLATDETTIRHEVMEWISETLLSSRERDALLSAFPPTAGDILNSQLFEQVARAFENPSFHNPTTWWGRLFRRIRNFFRSFGLLPLSSQELLDDIHSGGHRFTSAPIRTIGERVLLSKQEMEKLSIPQIRAEMRRIGLPPTSDMGKGKSLKKFLIKEIYGSIGAEGNSNPAVMHAIRSMATRRISPLRRELARKKRGENLPLMGRALEQVKATTRQWIVGVNSNLHTHIAFASNHDSTNPFAVYGRELTEKKELGREVEDACLTAVSDKVDHVRKDVEKLLFGSKNMLSMGPTESVNIRHRTTNRTTSIDLPLGEYLYVGKAFEDEAARKVLAETKFIKYRSGGTSAGIVETTKEGFSISEDEQRRIHEEILNDPVKKALLDAYTAVDEISFAAKRDGVNELLQHLLDIGVPVKATEKDGEEFFDLDLAALKNKFIEEADNNTDGEAEFAAFLEMFGIGQESAIISSLKRVPNHVRIHIVKVANEKFSDSEYKKELFKETTLRDRKGRMADNDGVFIPDIISLMHREIQESIKIKSQMVPIFKMKRLMRNSAVKAQMHRTLGTDFYRDMEHHLAALEGIRTLNTDVLERAGDWLTGRIAVLGLGSGFTMAKMMFSYPLAATHMWNPGLMSNPKVSIFGKESSESKKERENSLFYKHRYQHSKRADPAFEHSAGKGQVRRAVSKRAKFPRFAEMSMDFISLADKRATKMIWRMATADVESRYPSLKGKEKWSKVYNHWVGMIEKTQPMSDLDIKSNMLVRRKGLAKVFMFFGQRTQMVNELLVRLDAVNQANTPEGKRIASGRLALAGVNVLAVNPLIMATITLASRDVREFLSQAWGDEEEEEPDEDSLIGKYLTLMSQNVVGMLPVIGDIAELGYSPRYVGRSTLTSPLVEPAKQALTQINRLNKIKNDMEETNSRRAFRILEERQYDATKKLITSVVQIHTFMAGLPIRYLDDFVFGYEGVGETLDLLTGWQ